VNLAGASLAWRQLEGKPAKEQPLTAKELKFLVQSAMQGS